MKLVDLVNINVFAGNGGNGVISFHHDSLTSLGGPDGGNGGNGGDIILEVDKNLNTLRHLIKSQNYKAKNGENGRKKNQHGKNGNPLIIKIPNYCK